MGPLSEDDSWGKHMGMTSKALYSLSQVGGPRCCKRDAFLSFKVVIEYINSNYNVELEHNKIECYFSNKNKQCIKESCPFIERGFDDNLGLENPTGKTDEDFKMIIKEIEKYILK